jgi:chromosome segregation ATPase
MLESQSEHTSQELTYKRTELELARKQYSEVVPKLNEKEQQILFLKSQLSDLGTKFQKMVQTDQRKLKDKDIELKSLKNRLIELESKVASHFANNLNN